MWRRGEYEAGTALGLTAPGTEADVRFTPQSGHSLTVSPMAAFDPKRTFRRQAWLAPYALSEGLLPGPLA